MAIVDGPWRRGVARTGVFARILTCVCVLGSALTATAHAADHAVAFMYHRFGESQYPSTNIRIEQFEAHLAELASRRYNVMPLADVIAALRSGKKLPDRTVAITIDDAYLSVYTEAKPRLEAAGFPYTVFVSTDYVDRALTGIMSWDQLRELQKGGATIGGHSASHARMATGTTQQAAEELERSNARYKAELGKVPGLFAYPYGEYSLLLGTTLGLLGVTTAFGQHSGVIHSSSDFMYLPRFALNEAFGDIDRFRLAANALPLRVSDLTPPDPLLTARTNPPPFGFTAVGDAGKDLRNIACYATGQGRANIVRLGERRIEVRLEKAFPPGRARINCTMPAQDGRWRWFGMQFLVRN